VKPELIFLRGPGTFWWADGPSVCVQGGTAVLHSETRAQNVPLQGKGGIPNTRLSALPSSLRGIGSFFLVA